MYALVGLVYIACPQTLGSSISTKETGTVICSEVLLLPLGVPPQATAGNASHSVVVVGVEQSPTHYGTEKSDAMQQDHKIQRELWKIEPGATGIQPLCPCHIPLR